MPRGSSLPSESRCHRCGSRMIFEIGVCQLCRADEFVTYTTSPQAAVFQVYSCDPAIEIVDDDVYDSDQVPDSTEDQEETQAEDVYS